MRARVVLFTVTVVLVAADAEAGILRVEQDGSGDYVLIQDAVDTAASGDTILIGPGRYDDLQPRGVNSVVSVAYWEDSRNLTFIGEDADSVIIGPTSYSPAGTGPQGIHQHTSADIRVASLRFENLRFGVVTGGGTFVAEHAQFDRGGYGISNQGPDTNIVRNCSFSGFDDHAVGVYNATHALIEDCELTDADIYFGNTLNGVIKGCVSTGGGLATYYMSEGLVEGCDVQTDLSLPCIYVRTTTLPTRLVVQVQGNVFRGGGANLAVVGSGSLVQAERNSFSGPTDWDMMFDLGDRGSFVAHNNHIDRVGSQYVIFANSYAAGNDAVIDLGSNYWFDDGTPAQLDSLIWDGNDDPTIHVIVNYDPIETEPVPTEKKSFGGFKALYR